MDALIGLVVCGGNSSRMGEDKSMIRYHQLPQCLHIYHQLEPFCKEIWIAGNESQSTLIDPAYNFMADSVSFGGHGPISPLLTAFEKFLGAHFLVIGCDYPMLQNDDIDALVNNRENNFDAVALFDAEENIFDPLLAIYENSFKEKLFENYREQQYSLQKILKAVKTKKVILPHKIKSIDTKEEMAEIRRFISCRPERP